MLEGPNVVLRLFAESDVDQYLAAERKESESEESSPATLRPIPVFKKKFAETGFWEEGMGRMVVTDKEGGLLGTVMFFKDPSYQSGYEVGYAILRKEDRGHGYMTEALRIFSAYLFETKKVPRLQITTFEGNIAARRVAEKCGYRFEGIMRQMGFLRGRYVDAARYSLLRGECCSLAEALGGKRKGH
ncbi:MAG: GNAT family N-acetyltransferase [Phycisphaerales bacterium]|nr:MAG: GNAT family N-acetyltransferase [Phycisphaerales bacterium]